MDGGVVCAVHTAAFPVGVGSVAEPRTKLKVYWLNCLQFQERDLARQKSLL